ncbi:MAG: (Fe-S)-binding protein [Nitrospirae bacterium]|nr:(Fe-S)-binding protein [Nitrospirota bacterium]
MNELQYNKLLIRCVKCGSCKSQCPTYLTALDETMSARGRIAMLGAISTGRLKYSKELSEKIFSCMLCGACRDICPTGIDILEAIYHGRIKLKSSYSKNKLLAIAAKFSAKRMNFTFSMLGILQKLFYQPLYKTGRLPYIPEIASTPFKDSAQVYKRKTKIIGRIGIFAGCSINYLQPHLGVSLLNVLLEKGYEVVVLKGEVCCGSPMRALGLEDEAIGLARKNIELFNHIKAQAILSMCPTCVTTIKKEYPLMTGDGIEKIMDVNEFFIKSGFYEGLKVPHRIVTYHDPCHLNYGLGIKNEPREILKGIDGIEFREMEDAGNCCGFGGLFSVNFQKLSKEIGSKKIKSVYDTEADTIVTSCPGCMIQLENLKQQAGYDIDVMHIVEVLENAMENSA